MTAPALSNRLGDAQSPYLLQHRGNPVHWQPWDDAAFALARGLERPVLLSIGYSSCHWCHVMAHESFEDSATAAVMNALFVNIKVDREERPDLDRLFLSALARMGKQAGWPATVFLTPDGAPFAGGGYFPREPAFGLPAFADLLRQVAAQYQADPAAVTKQGQDLVGAITARYRRSASSSISPALLDHVAHELARSIDWLYGGFGQAAPKFLHAGGHEIVLRAAHRLGEPKLLAQVAGSMGHVCRGGVYDHLGGGFHRYATDDRWQVPHFEKMLHDNALMVSLLTKLWQATKSALFAARVAETVGWMLREMRLPGGGFAASQDADLPGSGSGGNEGGFYTWDRATLREVLGPDAAGFFACYDEADDGAFGGRVVLCRAERAATPDPNVLGRLRRHRDTTGRPARDGKLLADWNGLAITALAEAGLAFGRAEWVAAAEGALADVVARLGVADRLCHSVLDGQPATIAFADDYACMAQAALALFEATARAGYLDQARAWVAVLDGGFWDGVDGGYYFTEQGADAFAARQKLIDETTMPAANGTMLGVLARLAALSGTDAPLRRAEGIIQCFADRLSRGSIAVATALNNSQAPQKLVQIVVVGDGDALFRAAAECFVPDRLLVRAASGEMVREGHPAHGKGLVSGQAAAYVCIGPLCLPPVTDPAALRNLLAAQRAQSMTV